MWPIIDSFTFGDLENDWRFENSYKRRADASRWLIYRAEEEVNASGAIISSAAAALTAAMQRA